MQLEGRTLLYLVVALLLFWQRGGVTPDVNPGPGPSPSKATAATYVYEKDEHAVPGGVQAAFNKLNREKRVVATLFEADTKDGTGDTPDQYRVPLAAAKEAGLPALVVTAGDKVLKVVKDPRDEQSVLEAVR
jgi:hypothetical protein